MNGYVYMMRNTVTNGVYIGGTINDPRKRFSHHVSILKHEYAPMRMKRDADKHGIGSFRLCWWERCDDIREVEPRLIKAIRRSCPSYNSVHTPVTKMPKDPEPLHSISSTRRMPADVVRTLLNHYFVEGHSASAIARAYGVSTARISSLLTKRSYRDNPDIQAIEVGIARKSWNGYVRNSGRTGPAPFIRPEKVNGNR